jgi:FAD binding domain
LDRRALCDGIVFDLSGMNGVVVDRDNHSVRIQGGARAADVVAVTDRLGVATVTGSVSAVGVTGLTLGGGYVPINKQVARLVSSEPARRLDAHSRQLDSISYCPHPLFTSSIGLLHSYLSCQSMIQLSISAPGPRLRSCRISRSRRHYAVPLVGPITNSSAPKPQRQPNTARLLALVAAGRSQPFWIKIVPFVKRRQALGPASPVANEISNHDQS